MLYTVKDDKLIKSKIIGDRKTILNLLESAKKDKTLYHSYVYYRYSSIFSKNNETREYLNKGDTITFDKVDHDSETGYLHRLYKYNKSQSINFLYNTNIDFSEDFNYTYNYDKNIVLLRMLKNDLKRLKDIQEILSKLDKDTAQNVIKELYEDFYFFATEVLDSIKLEQVQAYDLSDLKTLEKLDKKYDYDIKPKVTNLIKPAENNTKVLKLAKDLNRLK